MARILLVTAVPAEAQAALERVGPAAPLSLGPYDGLCAGDLTAVAGGVGPARSAACAGTLLALGRYDLVISLGLGGGFPDRAAVGDVVVADRVVHADLGAASPDGFLGIDELGLGELTTALDQSLVRIAAIRTGAIVGPVLTVSSVTGTDERAISLANEHDPAAEAMEGAGVLAAALAHGIPFLEVRGISNIVGRRDRAAWDLPGALAALGWATAALTGGSP